ncbi:conserved hypothetical protein [Histoplasma capsulatum var. duboisii H88]|uniref:Ran guanine nucleotide release factor n=2 Tax=Ajellomyces capsulatus TaxID=5037 RepID=F0U7U1_AJEC8|nr:conserved hypothetical protein [Histoplasma capsulatum H143]EGC42453.1 conserved hypothetical protein [Histoplasma capsulatum var. duboisii H88]QSS51137.1 hypothetical protein I7I53_06378 [Histoplasma capsulatum var. duboisii H88]
MATFSPKDLFGGAIVADLPVRFLNVSDMREVPDNQEAFVSDSTRTSILIEINERLNLSQLQQGDPQQAAATTPFSFSLPNTTKDDAIAQDLHAAAFHLHEICEISGDSYKIIDNPQLIQLPKLPQVPAYLAKALITSSARDVDAAVATSTCRLLLIRLMEKSTDIIAYIVVPHSEFDDAGDPRAAAREEAFAEEAMANVVESFEIRDYGLFC